MRFTCEVHRLAGWPDAAPMYDRCLAYATEHSWPFMQAMGLRGLGELDRVAGRLRQATRRLRRSLEVAEPLGMPLLTGRVRRSLAETLRATGDLEGARQQLAAARSDFEWAENDVEIAAVDHALGEIRDGVTDFR